MSKNLDETVRLQFENRQEWIQEIRGERLQGIAESMSRAPRLASSSAALFLRRNECPGTHCRLIVKEEREDSSCQRAWGKRKGGGEDRVVRTERESDRRREVTDVLVLPRPGISGKRACRMAQASAEKLGHTGPAEKKRVASVSQREQLASMPERPWPKRKGSEPSVQSTRS